MATDPVSSGASSVAADGGGDGDSGAGGLGLVRSLLGELMRVEIADGRELEGLFECLDDSCNLVLSDTREWPPGGPPRYVGTVMVPGKVQVRIRAQKPRARPPRDGSPLEGGLELEEDRGAGGERGGLAEQMERVEIL